MSLVRYSLPSSCSSQVILNILPSGGSCRQIAYFELKVQTLLEPVVGIPVMYLKFAGEYWKTKSTFHIWLFDIHSSQRSIPIREWLLPSVTPDLKQDKNVNWRIETKEHYSWNSMTFFFKQWLLDVILSSQPLFRYLFLVIASLEASFWIQWEKTA